MLALFLCSPAYPGGDIFFSEGFEDLENWEPYYFPRIKTHSEYGTGTIGGEDVLVAVSNSSASALIYKEEFDVYEYPRVRWRWMVSNVYEGGDARTKSGDDYPARVYIMFVYDPSQAAFGKRLKYGLARRLYGEYPPHSSLNYIWANRRHEEGVIVSPYTDESMMLVLRWGEKEAGEWLEEEVDIVSDYRRAFGTDPPRKARIAVMNDSDNTGEASVSYFDYIKVLRGHSPLK